MKKIISYLAGILVFAGFFFACNNTEISEEDAIKKNPHAEGFDLKGSDPEAIAIADNVMLAMGGRKTWDTTRYIKWNFFGRRDLLWDKKTGNVRIDSPNDSTVYLVNVLQDTGSVFINGARIDDQDSLQKMVSKGKSIWINDSYWLLMPFKLKDSGVTLKHLREDTLENGTEADVLHLTFKNVGNTPQNKYEVYVDRSDSLVKQWSYFSDASQDEPSAVWPWDNYQSTGGLKLSYNRSDNRGPRDVSIYSELPSSVFTSVSTPDWDNFTALN